MPVRIPEHGISGLQSYSGLSGQLGQLLNPHLHSRPDLRLGDQLDGGLWKYGPTGGDVGVGGRETGGNGEIWEME